MDRRSGLERFVVSLVSHALFMKGRKDEKLMRIMTEEVLPRSELWRDIPLEKLLERDMFLMLHSVFQEMEKEPILFPMVETMILNEVGYEVTWLCHEENNSEKGADMEQFERNVYSNIGLSEHAKAVMSLVYAVVEIVNDPPLAIGTRVRTKLRSLNRDSWCHKLISSFIFKIKKLNILIKDVFLPYYVVRGYYGEEYFKLRKLRRKNTLYKQDENEGILYCAEEPFDANDAAPNKPRRVFTLESIVEFAKENLTLEMSVPIQNMLYALLGEDGNKEEREMVASIPKHIIRRSIVNVNSPGNLIGNSFNYGKREE